MIWGGDRCRHYRLFVTPEQRGRSPRLSLTSINNPQPLFLNHASLRKHLREMKMAQLDLLAQVNTDVFP
jgi:hypothetical protein